MLRFIIILLSVILFSSPPIIAKDSQEKNAVRNYFIKCIMHIITGGELTRFLCVLDDEKKLRISKLNERALQ